MGIVPSKVKTRILQFYVEDKDGNKLSKWDTHADASAHRDRDKGEKIKIGWIIVKGDK